MENVIFLVLVVVLFLRISSIKKSQIELKAELQALKLSKPQVFSETLQVPLQQSDNALLGNQEIKITQIPVSETATPSDNDFILWFKENPLLKIGVIMIIIGFGWFVSYAFTHNWIGPVGRITLGILVGTLVTIFGTMRLGKDETQGIALTVLGSALTIITLVAGTYAYSFFGPLLLLAMVFGVSLYVSLSAVAYSSKKLGIYGIIISMFAPLFSTLSLVPVDILYLYLAIVSISTIWIAVAKKWEEVISVGITGIVFYSLPHMFFGGSMGSYPDKYFILFVVYVIAILYLVFGIWNLIKNKQFAEGGDVYLAILNTGLILGFTMAIVPTVYQSLTIAAWMLVYAVSGFLVFAQTKNEKLFYIHSLISIFLLAVATSIELSGQTLIIAFTIEIAVVALASFVVTGQVKIAEAFSILLVVPAAMSLESFNSNSWSSGIFHSDMAVLLVLALVLATIGLLSRANKTPSDSELKPYQALLIASSFYFYAIIWLAAHSLIVSRDAAVFISLFIYTIIGLSTHLYGLYNRNSTLKNYGMTLLILVVTRLGVVDVWRMEIALRVVTFVVLGVMFMSTAFISKKQKNEAASIIQN